MQTLAQPIRRSSPTLCTGRTISALAVLFLLFDTVIKVLKLAPAVEATTGLGYPESLVIGIGLLELLCLTLYILPRTSIVGAVLLTGYLGGAVATHVRSGSGLFAILFPVILGVLMWGGLYLRDKRLHALMTKE